MNDTEAARHTEIERIRSLTEKLRTYAVGPLRNLDLNVRLAAQAAAQRFGEASVLHAIGEIGDDALSAAREAWRDARDAVEAAQLQAGAVQSLRQRLGEEMQGLLAPDRAQERERRVARYEEIRAAFERDFATMPEGDIVANGRALYDAACRIARVREVKDYFAGIKNRRGGASLQQFV